MKSTTHNSILLICRAFLPGLAFMLVACSQLPERIDSLERAGSNIQTLESDPLAKEAAAVELAAAREALTAANRAYEEGEELEVIKHHAYVADRHARIAEQQIAEAYAREKLARGEARRNEVLLEAREREAEIQASRAATAQRQAVALARKLQAVQAEKTERGLVLTLGDILFDTDEASLKPGASGTLDELSEFLTNYKERRVLIEGHADARGPTSYNINLSRRRARAVQSALEQRGVKPERIKTVGLGESFPVASNETSAGMQQNRRVEIVLSDADGIFSEAATKRAATLMEAAQASE